jgi:predicted PurR-regulated permease PerM
MHPFEEATGRQGYRGAWYKPVCTGERRPNTQRSVCMILSLGDFLWSLLVIFFMVIYFMMLFQVIVDIFRRHDASGGKKALWLLFLLCVPLVGLLAYMITNSESMAERNVQSVKQSQAEFDSYVQTVAGSGGSAAEIAKAKELLDSGAINQSEFDALKAKALA